MSHERLRPDFFFTAERIEKLKDVAPEAFADGKVNWTALRESLGDWLEEAGEEAEHFGLTWPGKRDARRLAALPSRGTLVPVPGEGVDEEKTLNLFVEGDNLEVLKLLQKSYAGRVKMIYIDPPYNTGKDFIYEDDFAESIENYLRRTGQLDEQGQSLTTNTRADGRFHSKWLSMMYPRLRLARGLLTTDGVVFISIDDVELSNLLALMAEIFGEENKVGVVCWKNVTDNNPTLIVKDNEFIVCFARDKTAMPPLWRSDDSDSKTLLLVEYNRLKQQYGADISAIQREIREFLVENSELVGFLERYKHVDKHGLYTGSESVHNPRPGGYQFEVLHPVTGRPMRIPANGYRFPEPTFRELEKQGRILFGEDERRIVKIKKYVDEYEDAFRSVITMDGRLGSYDLKRVFETEESPYSNPKPVDLMKLLVSFSTFDDDLILDLFAGSGSLGQAVLERAALYGRRNRVISVQWPEVVDETTAPGIAAKRAGFKTIPDIGIERLRRVIKKLKKEKTPSATEGLGFRVFRLARSHYRAWADYEGDSIDKVTDLFAQGEDALVGDWAPEGLLTEVMLIEGFPLESRVESLISFRKNTVTQVSSDYCAHKLVLCLDEKVYAETTKALDLGDTDVFVCLDKALTDEAKVRLADRCILKTV